MIKHGWKKKRKKKTITSCAEWMSVNDKCLCTWNGEWGGKCSMGWANQGDDATY